MSPTPPLCLQCKHLTDSDEPKCEAFPRGIPDQIWFGTISKNRLGLTRVDHTTPYQGDNGIQFVAIDDSAPVE